MSFWQKASNRIKKIPPWMIGLSMGVVFLLIGIYREQLADIYQKAVMICLECIGIG